jgi:hypothetical protein
MNHPRVSIWRAHEGGKQLRVAVDKRMPAVLVPELAGHLDPRDIAANGL